MTSNDQIDAVGLLFSDEETRPYPNYSPDCPNCGRSTDYYNISVTPSADPPYYFTNTVRMILPSGARKAMNAKAGDIIRLTNDPSDTALTLRTIVRAYAEKFPGFLFSDF